MANRKGKSASPAKDALGMGGTIRLSLKPDLLDKLRKGQPVTLELVEHTELYLQFEEGPENRILELSPWFIADKARVTVDNNLTQDGATSLSDSIEIIVRAAEDQSFGFSVTPAQAEALASVLTRYVQAHSSVEALVSEQPSA